MSVVGKTRPAVLAAIGLALVGQAAWSAAAPTQWAATWHASPEQPRTPALALNAQTIRQVVRISLGGNRFRIRLSNLYNDKPLRIGAAHIALAATGSAIQLGTDRVLSFGGGSHEVTIPAHAYVYSDAVDLPVPSLGSIAVSLYLPGNERSLTEHFFALQTGYIAARDVTGANTLPGATTVTRRLLLSGVDVAVARRPRVIVALGDSLTGGYGSTLDSNRRWTDALAERLVARKQQVAVVNAGIGGNRLLHDVLGPNAVSRFDQDVLSQAGVSHVVVLIGINDFGFPGGRNLPQEDVTVEQMLAGFRQLIARAHERGVKIIAGTLLPFGAIPDRPGYYTAASAAKREALNKWLRTSKEFDGVIDFEAAVRDAKDPTRIRAEFDSGDHLNLNDAGYKAMAEAIDLKLLD